MRALWRHREERQDLQIKPQSVYAYGLPVHNVRAAFGRPHKEGGTPLFVYIVHWEAVGVHRLWLDLYILPLFPVPPRGTHSGPARRVAPPGRRPVKTPRIYRWP